MRGLGPSRRRLPRLPRLSSFSVAPSLALVLQLFMLGAVIPRGLTLLCFRCRISREFDMVFGLRLAAVSCGGRLVFLFRGKDRRGE